MIAKTSSNRQWRAHRSIPFNSSSLSLPLLLTSTSTIVHYVAVHTCAFISFDFMVFGGLKSKITLSVHDDLRHNEPITLYISHTHSSDRWIVHETLYSTFICSTSPVFRVQRRVKLFQFLIFIVTFWQLARDTTQQLVRENTSALCKDISRLRFASFLYNSPQEDRRGFLLEFSSLFATSVKLN